jgi:hypothetical protein
MTEMLPRRLTVVAPEEVRRGYKIVRRDTMADVPGLILSASAESGLCLLLSSAGVSQEFNFGPEGLIIIGAGR